MKGYIHSTESFGTVDGPGIRYVVFMQGCPLRCIYCHNPDTWEMNKGQEIEPSRIISEYKKNIAFYSKGGITLTGGEPLLQIDFAIELFRLAKAENIHTCIDTSGITFNSKLTEKLDELLRFTDIVMLDIKHIDAEKHKELTGASNENILEFAKYLDEKDVEIWIRHVVIPNCTDDKESLFRLGEFIGTITHLKALDVLPYHTMGVNKYKELDIPYKLEGLESLSKTDAKNARDIILSGIRKSRQKL